LDAEARRRAAQNQNQQDDANNRSNDEASAASPAAATPAISTSPAPATRGRRAAAANSRDEEARKKEQKAIEKIKASKKFQKRKRGLDSDDEDDLARALLERSAPLPGQQENCENCGTRFTVTTYSRNGPNGGLLCTPCSKEVDKDDAAKKKKVKRASGGSVGRRRQLQSNILDGTYSLGAKSLMTLCIETLAKNIDLAEDFGDLPSSIIDKIARKLSKHRLLDPRTLSLFLQPTTEEVLIYDGAKLSSDDFIRIFQTVPGLKKLKVSTTSGSSCPPGRSPFCSLSLLLFLSIISFLLLFPPSLSSFSFLLLFASYFSLLLYFCFIFTFILSRNFP
jgi:DNA repair protein RAD7